jgi:hypothetical protein
MEDNIKKLTDEWYEYGYKEFMRTYNLSPWLGEIALKPDSYNILNPKDGLWYKEIKE